MNPFGKSLKKIAYKSATIGNIQNLVVYPTPGDKVTAAS